MNIESLKTTTKEELEQLEKDLEKCEYLVSKEAIRESIRIRKEALQNIDN
ncbi:hypothetical protein [Priestia megaterium]|nr:hypothetical protein [Priestia megaterium]